MSATPLVKITSVQIFEVSYDLAQNGGDFHLVEYKEPDAYLHPVARKVNLDEFLSHLGTPRVQSILNLLGVSYSRITALEEELSRAHTALQREAEPDAKSRRPVSPSRESSAGISNILEAKGEES